MFWHYPHYGNQGGFPSAAVRLGDHKLIQRLEDGRVHLFDLAHDPGEQRDLAAAQPERAAALAAELHAWQRRMDEVPAPEGRARAVAPGSSGPALTAGGSLGPAMAPPVRG